MTTSRIVVLSSALLTAVALAGGVLVTDTTTPPADDADTDVIVILRDQRLELPATHELRATRLAALSESRAPIITELTRANAKNIRAFNLINAVAAKVSKAEAAQLASHPRVQAVIADKVIRMPEHRHSEARPVQRGAAKGSVPIPEATGASTICNTLEPEALQLTHTAFLDPAVPQAQELVDGHGNKITGRGVRVAFLADGLDPTLAGFIRPDGTNVFFDYQDFTGDPPATPTTGSEAFGDASSVAAQDHPNGQRLIFNLDGFVIPNYPLPSPCNIQIRGMAPGASLVGLKVFSNLGYTTTSAFVQAIEYAILKDDVDIINESFSYFYSPDNDNDPISLANKAAVDAGVTVVGITYDGGTTGTFESPGTDPWVIAVGATTQYRLYAQTSAPVGSLMAPGRGYLDNNISPLSSAGYAETGTRTVDVVAPGDLGWSLCSTNQTLYTECEDNQFNPTPIQAFGGTSESAPLTSGEAALVIQAYRSTHEGASPSPALIKRIIMSTATDLGAPVNEQGAGLINALAAVRLALTVDHERSEARSSGGLLVNPTSTGFTAPENAEQTATFTINNWSAGPQQVVPHLQRLGSPFAGATLALDLDTAKAPQFVDPYGSARSYTTTNFHVPTGAQYLDVSIAWPGTQGSSQYVRMAVLDPSGRLASFSFPQGPASNYGRVDVVHPAAGTWTAILYTHAPPFASSYTGPIQLTWAASHYVEFGSVSPARLELKPGASATFKAKFHMPGVPGDSAASIHFDTQSGASAPGDIPITLRTLIPIGATGGNFTGMLTGGNGRSGIAPTQSFAFDVPDGLSNMALTVSVADSGYSLAGLLLAPNGMQESVAANIDLSGNPQYGLQLSRFNPQPGRWRFVLLQNYNSSGNQTSLPFSARIGFDSAQISAPSLPDTPGVHLSARGAPVVVPVQITNTGPVTAAYFVDARLRTRITSTLTGASACGVATLPGLCTLFMLPTEVSDVQFTATSAVPITMDASAGVFYEPAVFIQSPDIYARQVSAHTVAATLREAEVPFGPWYVTPALAGPYGPAGALTAPVTTGAKVAMLQFDPAITSETGDFWADQILGTSTYHPLILSPGESGIVHIAISPDPKHVGTDVAGYLFVDTYNPLVSTGNEVVRLPYRYTISP